MVNVKDPRTIVAGALLLIMAVTLWIRLQPEQVAPAVPIALDRRGKATDLPRIGLDRLDGKRGPSPAGQTDVFQFGAPSTRIVESAPPPPVLVQPPPVVIETSPTPTPVPAMNVKYIGTVTDKHGLKVAVLMTDRKEVLTGKSGDLVANRLKIVTIGVESVDVQDLGSDHVRRIPLRAN